MIIDKFFSNGWSNGGNYLKHLTHSMNLICMNVISLLLLSNDDDSENGAKKKPLTTDKKINKESSR